MQSYPNKHNFISKSNKCWVSTKIRHTTETFIEATKRDIKEQPSKTKISTYYHLTKNSLKF